LDRRLYLPKERASEPERRQTGHVPEDVVYQKTWEIAASLLQRSGAEVPHGWVVGDDEFGRASEFRTVLRARHERYVLDVPCNTKVRDLDGRRPPRKKGRRSRKRQVPFRRVDTWAAQLPLERWTRMTIRDGSKEPLEVEAVVAPVRAMLGRRIGPEERLVVIRTLGPGAKTTYALSNAEAKVPLSKLVCVRSQRPRIERVLREGKGEVGLGHYEVRSWVGWPGRLHHKSRPEEHFLQVASPKTSVIYYCTLVHIKRSYVLQVDVPFTARSPRSPFFDLESFPLMHYSPFFARRPPGIGASGPRLQ
jgi:SRSO17 transposase